FQQRIVGAVSGPQQFIQLQLHRFAVAILRILNQEHHQERHDGRGRVNHQLPGVAVMEKRAGHDPSEDAQGREPEGNRPPGPSGNASGEVAESGFFCGPRTFAVLLLHASASLITFPRLFSAEIGSFPAPATFRMRIYSKKNFQKDTVVFNTKARFPSILLYEKDIIVVGCATRGCDRLAGRHSFWIRSPASGAARGGGASGVRGTTSLCGTAGSGLCGASCGIRARAPRCRGAPGVGFRLRLPSAILSALSSVLPDLSEAGLAA